MMEQQIVYRKPKGSKSTTPPSNLNEAGPSKPKPVRKMISNSNENSVGRTRGGMPGPWISFLDNILEGEDFEESLLALEGMVGSLFFTSTSHTRQLLALALSPHSCLDPNQQIKSRRIPLAKADPFIPTARKIRIAALRLLEYIATSTGAETIFRAAPGYGPDLSIDANSLDPSEFLASIQQKTNGKQKRSRADDDDDDDDDEDEGPFYLAGRRVGKCDDLWDFLGGVAESDEGNIVRRREEPIADGGWEMLRTFVGIWEEEARARKAVNLSPIAPSLLRQFKSAISGTREVSSKMLEIIFWPLTHEAPDKNKKENNSKTDVDDDEMTIGEKRIISGRIVALLAQLCLAGHLELPSFEREIITALQRLPESAFGDFLENLHLSPSLFTMRLCTSYLDLFAHHTKPIASASLIGTNTSPRRKALGATISSASLSQGLDSFQPISSSLSQSLPITTKISEYFVPPNVSNLLNSLAKIPSTVPLTTPSNRVVSDSVSEPLSSRLRLRGKRVSKGHNTITAADTTTNSNISVMEKSLRIFKLVKEVLISTVLEWDENDLVLGGGKERLIDEGLSIEKMKEVMEEVERTIELSRNV